MASLSAGTLSVNSSGVVSGSGWARIRYDAEVSTDAVQDALDAFAAALPTVGQTTPPYSAARPATADDRAAVLDAKVEFLRSIADRILAVTVADVTYLNANL